MPSKSIDRNVIMLGWVSYFTDMASALINPILPVFIVLVLHEGMDKLGIIVALATLFSYALRLLSGYLSDRYGIVKPLVVTGYALSALSKPLLFFSQNWQSVALLKGVERIGKGLRSAPKDLMIARYSQAKSEGKTFGFHKTLDIAGELSGSLLLFFTLLYFGQNETVLRNIFLLTLIPGLIGLFLLIFFVKDIPKPELKEIDFRLTANDRRVIKTLIFYFGFIFFMFSDAFFTMRAVDKGFSTTTIPLLFIVATAVQTLLSYPLGKLIDRIGEKKILALSLLGGVIAQLLLYNGSTVSIWIAYGFFGLFSVASLNANRALIAKASDNKGSVYGIFYASVALFAALGTALSGYLWEYFGADTALWFALCGTAIMTLIYLIVMNHSGGHGYASVDPESAA